jgi:hypothetical protein
MLLAQPGAGALALTYDIGIHAIVYGILLCVVLAAFA